jgi:hypothetical protein
MLPQFPELESTFECSDPSLASPGKEKLSLQKLLEKLE